MEYKKMINLLDDTLNQPSKFRTKKWIEINYQSKGVYNTISEVRFKTTMLKSSLCDYGDACILVKGTIIIVGAGDNAASRQADERKKGVISKNCVPFLNCKSEINNTEIEHVKYIDTVMPMYD